MTDGDKQLLTELLVVSIAGCMMYGLIVFLFWLYSDFIFLPTPEREQWLNLLKNYTMLKLS